MHRLPGHDRVERPEKKSGLSGAMIGKGNHQHFMLKGSEQPRWSATRCDRTSIRRRSVRTPALPFDWTTVSRVTMTQRTTLRLHGGEVLVRSWRACRSRSGGLGFRYREPPLPEGGIAISQSGETIDTLEALRYAKSQKQILLSIVNVPESAIARLSHAVLPAGRAGDRHRLDKAFTTQLIVLLSTAIAAGRTRRR